MIPGPRNGPANHKCCNSDLQWHDKKFTRILNMYEHTTCSLNGIKVHNKDPCVRLLLKTVLIPWWFAAMLVLLLVWHYLIFAFGEGGFGAGAEWAPEQGKGVDSALHPLRSCSSSCLPEWRAVDQLESSSLNTKPDLGKLPGAYYIKFNSTYMWLWYFNDDYEGKFQGESFGWNVEFNHKTAVICTHVPNRISPW